MNRHSLGKSVANGPNIEIQKLPSWNTSGGMSSAKDAAAPIQNGLTIDLEDWFHGLDLPVSGWVRCPSRIDICLSILLEMLAARKIHATFFVLGALAKLYPPLIRKLVQAGHEVGTHGFAHQFIYRQSRKEFCEDLRHSKAVLEDIICQPVLSYRAPFFPSPNSQNGRWKCWWRPASITTQVFSR